MRYQFDWQLRGPWDRTPSGWYYWTNRWFAQCADFTEAFATVGNIQVALQYAHRASVQCDWVRWGEAPLPSPGMIDGPAFHEPCFYGSPSDIGILGQCVLVRGYVDGAMRAYKRIRTPLLPSEVDGDAIAPSVLSYFAGNVLNRLAAIPLCTADGTLIESWDCRPTVLPWQVRHGTKRRERGVIGIPY